MSSSAKTGDRSTLVTGACLAVGVLAVMGAFNSYQVSKGYSEHYPDAYGGGSAESRFAPLLARVPPNAQLVYFTDILESQPAYPAAFLAAQYAVAPRQLLMLNDQVHPEWAVGNFSKPQDFAQAGEALGYRLEADLGNGVVLFRRKGS
jgi:hypothetical protein